MNLSRIRRGVYPARRDHFSRKMLSNQKNSPTESFSEGGHFSGAKIIFFCFFGFYFEELAKIQIIISIDNLLTGFEQIRFL